ncbi:MAG TPA: hypothetical protein VFC16_19210, partial [Nakamurella sp.]|nr:hypothetical protein [Nakamurella sp.]
IAFGPEYRVSQGARFRPCLLSRGSLSREVLFVLSTHSAGGVTSQDVALAGAISAQAARLAVTTN